MLLTALLVFGICGTCGVLLDLDHLVAYRLYGRSRRLFHKHYLLGAGLVFLGAGTCLGGFVAGMVLAAG